jgi:hypothetical protein
MSHLILPFPLPPSFFPFRIHAPAEKNIEDQKEVDSSPLGVVPHQLRGQLSSWKTLLIEGAAYDRCTGCSAIVSPFLYPGPGPGFGIGQSRC